MLHRTHRLSLALTVVTLALTRPTAAAPPGQIAYQIQSILKTGDPIGDSAVKKSTALWIDALNDNGQILFTAPFSGGLSLFQYSGGQFFPVAISGEPGPAGNWPKKLAMLTPAMNRQGSVVFTVMNTQSFQWVGTFTWDPQKQQTTSLLLPGSPAINGLVFGGSDSAVINDSGDIAVSATFKDSAGKPANSGLLLVDQAGKMTPIALSGDTLPGLGPINGAGFPSINDAGVVAFLAIRPKPFAAGAFVWEKGAITPVGFLGQSAPGGGTIVDFGSVRVNNANHNVLLEAHMKTSSPELSALYLLVDGQLTPVAIPGQPMPGGGTYQDLTPLRGFDVSEASDAGQVAFLARIMEGGQPHIGAYLMDANGQLSLIVKDGMTTAQGDVIGVDSMMLPSYGEGIAVNNKGQIALPLRIGSGPGMIALLTPVGQ